MTEIGVGMLGYAFMGKAHSNAFRKLEYMAWPPPLVPRLVAIAGRNEDAVAEAARRYGYERGTNDWHDIVTDERIGLFDNGGPNSLHAEPTIAAAEAGKHVLCEKPLGRTADESHDVWRRVAATGVKHLCGFNYRFVPAVRLARELIDEGALGEIRHFRGRYLQDWADDPKLDTGRFDPAPGGHVALRSGPGGIRSSRRSRHARHRPRALPRRRIQLGRRPREDIRGRSQGRRCDRGDSGVRVGSRRHDRVDAARARSAQRVSVGDQRFAWLALLRHGAHERVAGFHRRRGPHARIQVGAGDGGKPSVHGSLVAAGT